MFYKKVWLDGQSQRFHIFMSMQYLGVMVLGMKPVITPTYTNFGGPLKSYDIIL